MTLTFEKWQLEHDLLNTLKDVADGHYTPDDAKRMIMSDFNKYCDRQVVLGASLDAGPCPEKEESR